MVKHALFVAAVTLLGGCPDRSLSAVDPQQQGATIKDIPVSADIDVLFVIDNSASTSDKQALFAQNFPKFVQALDAFPTGRPNLHVAVIDTTVDIGVQGYGPSCPSPDPADNGVFQVAPRVAGCTPPTGKFITDIKSADGTRQVNYSGTLDSALSCIAQIGCEWLRLRGATRGDEARARQLAAGERRLPAAGRLPRGDLPHRRGRRVGQGRLRRQRRVQPPRCAGRRSR